MKQLLFRTSGILTMLCALTVGTASAQNFLEVLPAATTPGATATVRIAATHDAPVQGFQTVLTWDNTILTLLNIDYVGTDVATILGGAGSVEFFTSTTDAAISPGVGWGAAAAIFDFTPPFDAQTLPPGAGQTITQFSFSTLNDPLLIGTSTPLTLENGMGSPPLFNVLTVGGSSVLPVRNDGALTFIDQPQLKRGDANGDGIANLADVIKLIQYFFNDGSVPPCLAAADANGDNTNDLSDSIFLIQYQFLDGSPPAAPFPNCGIDPAGQNGLSCDSYNAC